MARTALVAQQLTPAGVEVAYEAANVDGNSVSDNGRRFIHVVNDDASSHTVTIPTPSTIGGLAIADQTIDVPAGESRMIGPFRRVHHQSGSRTVHLDYDDVTSVTVALIEV